MEDSLSTEGDSLSTEDDSLSTGADSASTAADSLSTEPASHICASCGISLANRGAFRIRHRAHVLLKCTRCSFVDRALMRRSVSVAAVVGTVLVGLNQGDQLLAGTFAWDTSWFKLPLTYAVPFCVATYGALSNGYRGTNKRAEA